MNPEHILKIRTSKDSIRSLAKQYGVSPSTIANIKAGRTYINPFHCPTCRQLLSEYQQCDTVTVTIPKENPTL